MRNFSVCQSIRGCVCFTIIFVLSQYGWSGHPTMDGEMAHPAQPLPETAIVPRVSFSIFPDMMDGYNLTIQTVNFNALPPIDDVEDAIEKNGSLLMQGHMHLYINGKKMMRVYGDALHVPTAWLKHGINSITLSVNNHRHGTFTHQGQEIQSTIIIDGEADELIKNIYTFPEKL